MNALKFTPDLECGITEIDVQHRHMVETVNQLHRALIAGHAGDAEDLLLDELIRLARENFRTEEKWMHYFDYEHFEVHAESHAHLLHELIALRNNIVRNHKHVNRKAVVFIRKWLEEHLRHSDRELAEVVRHQVAAYPAA